MNQSLKKILLHLLVLVIIAGPAVVFAAGEATTIDNPLGASNNSVLCFFKKVIDVILQLVIILAGLAIIYAGFLYVTAGGDESKLKSAKTAFLGAVIGTVVLLGIYAIIHVVIGTINAVSSNQINIQLDCSVSPITAGSSTSLVAGDASTAPVSGVSNPTGPASGAITTPVSSTQPSSPPSAGSGGLVVVGDAGSNNNSTPSSGGGAQSPVSGGFFPTAPVASNPIVLNPIVPNPPPSEPPANITPAPPPLSVIDNGLFPVAPPVATNPVVPNPPVSPPPQNPAPTDLVPVLSSVTINPTVVTMDINGTRAFTASPKDQNGNIFNGATITWLSSNPSVAIVNRSTGAVTGIAAGQATITVTAGSGTSIVTASASVTINAPPCLLTGASWSVSSASEGQLIQVRVGGSNCVGKTASFQVLEDDASFGLLGDSTDDPVRVNPPSATFVNGQAVANWAAEWQCDGSVLGICTAGNPEYYFIAAADGKTMRSGNPELVVSRGAAVCGDGLVTSPEQCDDGNTINGDGCSNSCLIEVNNPAVLSFETTSVRFGGNQTGDGVALSTRPVALFDTLSKKITVRYSGQTPATLLGVDFKGPGSSSPFALKGDIYPGTGGTCGTTITANCTIVVDFTPKAQADQLSPYSFNLGSTYYTYDNFLILKYNDGSSAKDATTRLLGYSYKPPEAGHFYGVNNFGSILVNSRQLSSTGFFQADGTREITDVHWLTPPSGDFSLVNDTCAGSAVLAHTACTFKILFQPTLAGKREQTVSLSYNDGISTKVVSATLSGEGFTPDPADNVLIIYNTQSSDSVAVKDYYLQNRPGMAGANVVGISYSGLQSASATCPPVGSNASANECVGSGSEMTTQDIFQKDIENPIANWLKTHPGKDIRSVILMPGIPSRLSGAIGGAIGSTQYVLSSNPATAAQYTSLDMGSKDATLHYIDKLRQIYNNLPVQDRTAVISASATGRESGQYFFDGRVSAYRDPLTRDAFSELIAVTAKDEVQELSPGAPIVFLPKDNTNLPTVNNVSGFSTMGVNSWLLGDNYATDGTVKFTGNSDWYVIRTGESFNGQRDKGRNMFGSPQSNFVDWFSANAFGGANYSNIPVGAVTHVEEPSSGGISDSSYFSCWEGGRLFIDCAWSSLRTPYMAAIGDPWVTR